MNATVLLQARTNSSRLPGKVLLPVEGIPLVVLAAQRAMNTGHHVIVVTSRESSDDALCSILERWDIEYFRGELENTLQRFVDALKAKPDDQVVVRLTGDNVLPDGKFIDELLKDFSERNLPYLCCTSEASGLPYGVSAEVTRARHLRDACSDAQTAFEREHVTPRIIENFGRATFRKYNHLGMAKYRCTVDTLDDYLRICRVFEGINKPQQADLTLLLSRLRQASPEVLPTKSADRLVLGTAQLGLPYGIANTSGPPAQDQVNTLVRKAIENGVQYLDTARAYGDSEQVLGRALSGGWDSRVTIITKLSPLHDCPTKASEVVVRAFVEQSVYKSCNTLGVKSLDVLMLHRAQHLFAWGGAAWKTLLNLKQCKLIGRLGVSAQTPEEALLALDFDDVAFIQLPFNILDHRWDDVIKKITETRQNRSLTVHARSPLLQGLLTTSSINLWENANCPNALEVIGWLRNQANVYTNGDVVALSLKYVSEQHWIDGIVIGVETNDQLLDNLLKVSAVNRTNGEINSMIEGRPHVSELTLNPAKWKEQHD